MDFISMIVFLVLLFFVIYWAVHWAIQPIIKAKKGDTLDVNGLIKLKHKGVISAKDMEDYQEMIQFEDEFEGIKSEYTQARLMYDRLKASNRMSPEDYINKIKALEEIYDMK